MVKGGKKKATFGGGWLERGRGSGGEPSGWASAWECRAGQSRQARPEEAHEPSPGTDQGPL